MTLPRPFWVRLNRLHTGIGLFRSTMHKWGLVLLATCTCGANGRSHTSFCPLYHPPKSTLGLAALEMTQWTGFKEQHSASDDKKSAQTKKVADRRPQLKSESNNKKLDFFKFFFQNHVSSTCKEYLNCCSATNRTADYLVKSIINNALGKGDIITHT